MKNMSRFIGAILLVSGTSIGAGMLALPVVTSFAGFFPSLILLAFCWLFLFATAWFFLDVNLSFPGEVNLISMVGKSLGTWGKIVCWISYLLLLYALTAAYIAGSSPLFLEGMNWAVGQNFPSWFGPIPLLIIFGLFVYLGTKSVDWVNRLLMLSLVLAYFLLIGILPSHVQTPLLKHLDFQAIWIAVPLIFTSYGFHIIIPTLTTYLKHDKKKLRMTIFIGSFVPFLVYVIWEFLVLGIVPIEGENSLSSAWFLGESSASPLASILNTAWIGSVAKIFSFFAIITSFLGVSLSLSDFLTDGLKMKRFSLGREVSSILTFFPPLFFVYAYPRGFIIALQFAGSLVAILLCIMPALMAWKLSIYKKPERRALLLFVILVSLFVIGLDILEKAGVLQGLILPYVQTQS